ncbi:hypothetical protein [Acinetobacter towneri]|uniref:hypothetical protein n=1 Tax=Acinetobacter towneri TaxID=202956 RepID=UPI0032140DC7
MPLPTPAEFRDRTKKHSQVRELLAQLAENVLGLDIANANAFFKPQVVAKNTNVNLLGNGFWIIPSDSVAATLTGLPPQLTQPRRGFIFAMTSGTTSYQKFTRDFSSNCEAYERTGNGKGWGGTEHAWLDWIPADLYSLENKLKTYVHSNPLFRSVVLGGTENFDNLEEGRYFIQSTAVANALNSQLPATASAPKIGWVDKVKLGNGLVQLVFTRYTQNSNKEYEVWRKTTNGGTSSLTWLDWQKDPSRYEIEKLSSDLLAQQIELSKTPRINCFKNVKLTSEEAVTYQATHRVENGIGIASLNNPNTADTAIFYDYEIDNYILVKGENISFEIEAFTDVVGKADISIQFYNGSSLISTTAKAGVKTNQFELLKIDNLTIPLNATRIRFRLIRRNGTTIGEFKKPVLVSSAWDAKYISAFQTTNPAVLDNLYYVSKSGSDSNKGNELSPFLTIQKAIDSIIASKKTGRAIINDNGWYRETVTNPSDLHIEIVAGRNKRPSIVGSDQLTVTKAANYTKVYQAPLATKPVGMGGARGKPLIAEWGTPYSVILDEDVHSVQRGDSYRLPFTPMYEAASLAELDTPNGNGKWWWESGVIYFSATDGSDATLKQYEARVRPCFTHSKGTMYLRGLDFLFSSAAGASFGSVGVVRDDCRVYGSYSNGFADNANSTMSRFDVAIFNGNDGFNGTVAESTTVGTKNAETTIRAVYFEPYGALNGDDGISFHIRGTCNIWGGLFEYNTKAGVVHVTGGGGNCYGTISRGQTNGFYTATPAPDGRNKSSMHCHNTIAEKNTYDYRAADDADLYCVGTYSDNPTGYGYYQTGTGKIVCKNAKYRGDPSKMKSGNVVVENFETVT